MKIANKHLQCCCRKLIMTRMDLTVYSQRHSKHTINEVLVNCVITWPS